MAWDTDSLKALWAMKPTVALTLPPAWFFRLPPSPEPLTLPPPSDQPTFAHPFTIPIGVYNKALNGIVPVTIALVYITTITFLNSVNKSRGYKPWAFSRTRFFRTMVITHNIILSLYSAWTFIGMMNTLTISLYNPRDVHGFAGTVDSLCKINGPRGMGSAAIYNEQNSSWAILNRAFHLGADGLTPDVTDVGRVWNEGLAFYGWLFYISKFYEVIDTLIIIAKGKKSSFLQTYHHAGAMVCMWAGIRYMSPPIWMFVLVNSFIHSIMYTFYLFTAIGVKVPVPLKRTLTTMQITQFVVGAAYAFIHLFIKYQTPVSVPYIYHLGSAASAVSSDLSSVVSTATATASADLVAHLKKLALRAAGREGLAENVRNDRGQKFGIDAVKAAQDFAHREEIRYQDELQWTHCLDTSGQAFAIYLNVLYLAPLTWLFARFFVKSYLRRLERRRSSTASQKAHLAVESAEDARRRAARRLSHAFQNIQGGDDNGNDIAVIDDSEFNDEVKIASEKAKETATVYAEKAKQSAQSVAESTSQSVSNFKEEVSNSSLTETVSNTVESATNSATQVVSSVKEEVRKSISGTEEGMSQPALTSLKREADLVKAKVESTSTTAYEKLGDGFETAKNAILSMVGQEGDTSQERDEQEALPDTSREGHEPGVIPDASQEREEQGALPDTSDVVNSVGEKVQEGTSAVIESLKSSVSEATSSGPPILAQKDDDEALVDHDPESSSPKSPSESWIEVQKDRDSPHIGSDDVPTDEATDKGGDVEQESSEHDASTDNVAPATSTEEDVETSGAQDVSPKEEVRAAVDDDGTEAEASTGDAEADGAAASMPESEGTHQQHTPSPEDTSQEDPSVEDPDREDDNGEADHGKDHNTEADHGEEASGQGDNPENVTGQEASGEDSTEQGLSSTHEAETKETQEHDSTQAKDEEAQSEVNAEGRQDFFQQEREEAIEKLDSANAEDKDDSDAQEALAGSAEVDPKSIEDEELHAATPASEGEHRSFDEVHEEALEKLKLANSESKEQPAALDQEESVPDTQAETVTNNVESTEKEAENDEPVADKDTFGIFDDIEPKESDKPEPTEVADRPQESPAEEAEEAEADSQDVENQKESWIQIDDDKIEAEDKESKLAETPTTDDSADQPAEAEDDSGDQKGIGSAEAEDNNTKVESVSTTEKQIDQDNHVNDIADSADQPGEADDKETKVESASSTENPTDQGDHTDDNADSADQPTEAEEDTGEQKGTSIAEAENEETKVESASTTEKPTDQENHTDDAADQPTQTEEESGDQKDTGSAEAESEEAKLESASATEKPIDKENHTDDTTNTADQTAEVKEDSGDKKGIEAEGEETKLESASTTEKLTDQENHTDDTAESDKPTFAEVVKNSTAEETDDKDVEEDKAQEQSGTEAETDKVDDGAAAKGDEPQWFEKLSTNIDSHEKVDQVPQEKVGPDTQDKSTDQPSDVDGSSKAEQNVSVHDQVTAEQDTTVAESEPVGNEAKVEDKDKEEEKGTGA